MGLLDPAPLPYDALEWARKPFAERARMVCEAWAIQGYGTPLGAYALHVVKLALYVGAWFLFCSVGAGSLASRIDTIGTWAFTPAAFQKAVAWSMLFEGLGLGCGSGPLTGRYYPPMGGALHFLRPGTTKLPLFPRLPILGGTVRTWIDVALYAAVLALLVRVLVQPMPEVKDLSHVVGDVRRAYEEYRVVTAEIDPSLFVPIALLVPLLGIADRTAFLAFRSEHYWTTIVCFVLARNWIPGAMAVQAALWFWAGFSKLNHHFPTVVCVMNSNSPFTRVAWFRRLMYLSYPGDLRPSRAATVVGHVGTALELGVPIVLLSSSGGWTLTLGLAMMIALHVFITSNVPMGVPIEWNVHVVYGGFALFWAHRGTSVLDLDSVPLVIFLVVMLVTVPLVGNFFPGRVSFLMAMRYYAGNWAYGVWLFRGDAYKKLDRVVKSSAWVYDQLDRFYDRKTAVGLVGKVMAFRLMHLHGRALPLLLPRAIPRLEDYEWVDGEIVAGLVLGWNFGDGHLHSEDLLRAVQAQCDFEEGELRCIFVEAQPLGQRTMAYRIHDAKTGIIEAGDVDVAAMRRRQPWAAG